MCSDSLFEPRSENLHAGRDVSVDVRRFQHHERLADAQFVPMWASPGKHGDDERPGISRDANGARRQRCSASEKGHWQAVLKKIVIDDKPGDLSPAQGANDAPYAPWGRFDHGHVVGMPQTGDAIKHEP
jgi:hypothetical protein